MLLYKLKELECALEKMAQPNNDLLYAVQSLKSLLLKIDYKYEKIPDYSYYKLRVLLEDVSGKSLTVQQEKLMQQIIK